MRKQADILTEVVNWVNGNREEIEILEVNEVGTSLEVFVRNMGNIEQIYIPNDAEPTIRRIS